MTAYISRSAGKLFVKFHTRVDIITIDICGKFH